MGGIVVAEFGFHFAEVLRERTARVGLTKILRDQLSRLEDGDGIHPYGDYLTVDDGVFCVGMEACLNEIRGWFDNNFIDGEIIGPSVSLCLEPLGIFLSDDILVKDEQRALKV